MYGFFIREVYPYEMIGYKQWCPERLIYKIYSTYTVYFLNLKTILFKNVAHKFAF